MDGGSLATVFRGENPITAAIFNPHLMHTAQRSDLPNLHPVLLRNLDELPPASFDYVVGTAILCHDRYPENLKAIYRLLKPGGQILFFENNLWNPQVFLKTAIRPLGRAAGHARCQVGMSKYAFLRFASQQGFTNIDLIPYDIIHPLLPSRVIPFVRSIDFVVERAPLVRDLCGSLYLWAKKPGGAQERPAVNLARHAAFRSAVSFVIACHNEEQNVPSLVTTILKYYGDYVHEILVVNDNSTDQTAAVTQSIAEQEPRVRLVNRTPPNGVGRALRDGYAAATGSYILTMDGDFVQIIPSFETCSMPFPKVTTALWAAASLRNRS